MELERVVKRRNLVMIVLFIIGFLQGSLPTGDSWVVGLLAGIIYAAITYVVFSIYIYYHKLLKKP